MYWKEKNPDYARQYRATSKSGKDAAIDTGAGIEEVLRLLRHARNNVAKNNLTTCVTKCCVEVFWIAAGDVFIEKNNFAKAKLIVIQGDMYPTD